MKTISIKLLLFFALTVFSCQDDEGEGAIPPPDDPTPGVQSRHTVQIIDSYFDPQNITISPGDTIVWTNNGTMIHTSTSGTGCDADGTWNSGNLNPGQSYSYIFTTEGSFDYFCIPHCAMGMVGKVTIEE